MSKIPGPTLLGFADFFRNDEVGALPRGALTKGTPTTPTKGAVTPRTTAPTAPTSRPTTLPSGVKATAPSLRAPSLPPGAAAQVPTKPEKKFDLAKVKAASARVFPKGQARGKISPHVAGLVTAAQVASRLKGSTDKLEARVKKAQAQNPAVAIGAAQVKPKTPKQQAAFRRLANAQGKLMAKVKAAAPVVARARQKAEKLRASISKAKPTVDKLTATPLKVPGLKGVTAPTRPAPKPVTRATRTRTASSRAMVGQDEYDYLFDEQGNLIEPSATPTDQGTYPMDAGEGAYPIPAPVFTPPLEEPIPARSPEPKERATEQWDSMPEGAVIYDGSRGFPSDTLGSWNLFYGQNDPPPRGTRYPDGWTFGAVGGAAPEWVVRDKAGIIRADIGAGQVDNLTMYENPTENMKKFWPAPASYGTVEAVARNSVAQGWGPLIGSKDLHGLHFSPNDGMWWWHPEHAPSWYGPVIQADNEIRRLNKEALDAAKTLHDEDMKQWEIDKAEYERNYAKTMLDQAMAVEQELTTSAIEQSRMTTQQQQFEMQQQQAQQQFEQQQAQAEFQQQQAQQQFEMQQAQAELEYAQKQGALEQQLMQQVISDPEMMAELMEEAPLEEGEEGGEEMFAEEEEEGDVFDEDYSFEDFEGGGDVFDEAPSDW